MFPNRGGVPFDWRVVRLEGAIAWSNKQGAGETKQDNQTVWVMLIAVLEKLRDR